MVRMLFKVSVNQCIHLAIYKAYTSTHQYRPKLLYMYNTMMSGCVTTLLLIVVCSADAIDSA
jgi:hypothetical protein